MKGVSMIRMTLHPYATCNECDWTRRGPAFHRPATVRSDAQHHVKTTGHTVVVDVLDRTDYAPEPARGDTP